MLRLRTLLLCLLTMHTTAVAAELAVPEDHPTITDAIKASSNGDTILVAPGTYQERLDTRGKAITIRGIDGAGTTIVSGDGPGRGSTLTCDSDESAATRLVNLTFSGGTGQMNMNRGEIMGGGLLVKDASPTFIGCVFRDNNAQYGSGGGIAITGGGPVFIECDIIANRSDNIGGGVLAKESQPVFIRCRLIDNTSPCGGGFYVWYDCLPTFESCEFSGNAALLSGGGIFNWNAEPILNNCRFVDNRSPQGSAICNLAGEPLMIETSLGPNQQVKHAQAHPLFEDSTGDESP